MADTQRLSSMTGFGRARGALSARLTASVVIRTVNHKYLDVQVRSSLKEELPEAEAAVREVVGARLERGRVSVQLNLQRTEAPGTRLLVDREAVVDLLSQLDAIEEIGDGTRRAAIGDVLGLPGVVLAEGAETMLDDDEVAALRRVTVEAVDELERMRRREGERLVAHLRSELAAVAEFVAWFEPQQDALRAGILERLREKISELLQGEDIDPQRLALEAAVLADKSDVAEEVVRLRSHLDEFEGRLRRGGSVGRTLDFLCQEVNRELNTLGAKCREPLITPRLVDARAATERIREQVQNLE